MTATDIIAIIAIISTILTVAWQINVSRRDAEKTRSRSEKDDEYKKWKADMEARMSKIEDKAHGQDIEINDRPARLELTASFDKVFMKMETVENKFDSLKTLVIEAINGGHRTGGQ